VLKPFNNADLLRSVAKALERTRLMRENLRLSETLAHRYRFDQLLGNSPAIREVVDKITRVADAKTTVLITGESGSGKELVARAIHFNGPRCGKPFLAVNCGALPQTLAESELFGHERGAFTGAVSMKRGLFEAAQGGTVFLDEVSEMPLTLQPKLLRVLESGEVQRVGSPMPIKLDVRVVAATNRNLREWVENGRFRRDLYYRLNVVEIRIPPLRERPEEIPVLAMTLLGRFNREYQRAVALLPGTLALFRRYPWPGNIRELDNVVRRLVLLANPSQIHEELEHSLRAAPLRHHGAQPRASAAPASPEDAGAAPILGLKEIARRAALEAERKALAEVLERVHWNRTEAARILKVSYKTLLTKITECGLSRRAAPDPTKERPV
jgi:DNA-binding NtrC family response regulator